MVLSESCAEPLFWLERDATQGALLRGGCIFECDGGAGNTRGAHEDSAADLSGNRSGGFADQGVAGGCGDNCASFFARYALHIWREHRSGGLPAAQWRLSVARNAAAGVPGLVAAG